MKYICDREDEYGIIELQEKILEIAVFIDKVCSDNNIEYFLMGGSALGAIRHGGFIPWDDDLDIFMRPEEYTKFRDAVNKTNDCRFYLQELMKRNELVGSAKIRLNNTEYLEDALTDLDVHQGIFVDIFILHNTSNFCIGRLFHCLTAKFLLLKGQSIKKIEYRGVKKFLIKIIKLLPREFGIRFCLRWLYKYDKKETKYVAHYLGKAFFDKGIYPSSNFSRCTPHAFEKVVLQVPVCCGEYLTKRFGDYMCLPNVSFIKKTQHCSEWKVNSNRFSSNQKYFDEDYII